MKYDSAGDFHEGLARVKLGPMTFINKSGDVAMRRAFAMVGNFSGGLASACVENAASAFHVKCGYIDKRGEWAIEPTFIFFLGDFRGKLAWACTEDKCGYINRAGQFLWSLRLDWNTKEPVFPSPIAGCSIMSDKDYWNYPCSLEFKLF